MKIVRLFVAFTLICFALSPAAYAVLPAPDGGYPGGNTAEGQNALFSLTSGGYNTGVGYFSLRSDTSGSFNTGVGAGTLFANTGDRNTATGVAALFSNTTGISNTANGTNALIGNTTGGYNTRGLAASGSHAAHALSRSSSCSSRTNSNLTPRLSSNAETRAACDAE
jgi:hypothetical protein